MCRLCHFKSIQIQRKVLSKLIAAQLTQKEVEPRDDPVGSEDSAAIDAENASGGKEPAIPHQGTAVPTIIKGTTRRAAFGEGNAKSAFLKLIC